MGNLTTRDLGLRCRQCGDLIGVYEAVIVRNGDARRETSLIAEPDLELAVGEAFHRKCSMKLGSESGGR